MKKLYVYRSMFLQRTTYRKQDYLWVSMVILTFLVCPLTYNAFGQNSTIHLHFEKKKTKKMDIRFQLIHNLIIIPAFINGSDTLKFVLDSGVSHTTVTSLDGTNGISFNYAREIELFGLGSGREVKAFHSFGNVLELPGVIGFNHNVIILKEEFDHLSQGLGTQINGLIGYDVFDGFTVEIDYASKKLTLYDPKFYYAKRRNTMLKKSKRIDIEVYRRKPYVKATLADENDEAIPLNLLIDSGASQALSLFQSTNQHLEIPENSIYTFLGIGLSGELYGHIGRVSRFTIGDFKFKKPIVTYPDKLSVQIVDESIERSGSLGAGILKRFTVVFDYHGKEMLLKPNSSFKNPFKYNLSGIDITTPVPDIPVYQISKIREGSPAWIAGLEEGDQLVAINGVETSEYNLSNIVQILQSKAGKKLTVGVRRQDQRFSAKFTLEDAIK